MGIPMTTSATGYLFIREREGLTLTVKPDTGGRQRIGYGHDLLRGESYPNGITEGYAELLLQADVAHDEVHVNAAVASRDDCTQGQFDALIDFAYECGPGALLQLLAHGWDQVPIQLPRWIHAHVDGRLVVMPGMVVRRALEVKVFEGQLLAA